MTSGAFRTAWVGGLLLGCQVTPTAGASELRPPTEEPSAPAKHDPAALSGAAPAQMDVEAPQPTEAAAPSAAPKVSRCPPEMALVGESCVDRYEAYLMRRQKDGTFRRHPEHERPAEGAYYEARSEAGARPQAYISSLEAGQACEHAGKRLCSLSEWTTACRGPSDTTYPYGKEFDRGKCNVGQKHVLAELHGKDPMVWTYDHFNDPELIQQSALAKSGSFEECTNGYGTYDMVGNLHEWVGDRVDPSLPTKVPLPEKIARTVKRKRGNGVFMGGFFSTVAQHGKGCEFITIAHEPKYHDYSTGFRCCRDAAP